MGCKCCRQQRRGDGDGDDDDGQTETVSILVDQASKDSVIEHEPKLTRAEVTEIELRFGDAGLLMWRFFSKIDYAKSNALRDLQIKGNSEYDERHRVEAQIKFITGVKEALIAVSVANPRLISEQEMKRINALC